MSWAELVAAAEAIRAGAADLEPRLATLPITAIGWATVDADRAFAEISSFLGVGRAPTWVPEARDALLGASARRIEPAPAEGVDLVVLEPDTEGRLAAFLARFGEAVGAVYLAGAGEGAQVVPVNARWGPYAIVRPARGASPTISVDDLVE